MSADLRITVLSCCTLFKIHSLEDRVLAVSLLDVYDGSLHLLFFFESRFLFGPLALLFRVIDEDAKLLATRRFFPYLSLGNQTVDRNIHSSNKQVGVYDLIKEVGHLLNYTLSRGSVRKVCRSQ